jgi:hypothetical protein
VSAGAEPRPRPRSPLVDPIELIPLPLVILAEAAWLSVVAGLTQELILQPPTTTLPELAAAVIVGLVAARVVAPRAGSRWPGVALVLVVVAAIGGCLVEPFARGELGGGLAAAFGAHPGGLLVGIAVLRGIAHARLPLAEDTVSRLLTRGAPGIAIAAVFGGIVTDPYRTQFLADTTAAGVIFIGSTVLALAFTRLAIIGLDHGLDWRRNRTWLVLALIVLAGAIAFALPMARIAGETFALAAGLAFGPILVIGLATGLDRAGRRVIIGIAIFAAIAYIVMRLGLVPGNVVRSDEGTTSALPNEVDPIVSLGVGGLLAFLAAVTVLILVALWARRTRVATDLDVAETRTVDRTAEPRARRSLWRPHRRHDPTDAVTAYVELIRELDRHPELRRDATETPAEHARRLRLAGAPSLPLDLLAADYALVRDAGTTLPPREERRAVDRWRQLRSSLAGWARVQAEGAAAGPATSREDLGPRPDAAREDEMKAGRQMS